MSEENDSIKAMALSSLALLMTNVDANKDYLEYLRPFIMDILSDLPQETPISDSLITQAIKDTFGLIIPTRTIQILLRRIAKSHYFIREHGVYRLSRDIPSSDFKEHATATLRKTNAVVMDFIEFSQNSLKKEISEDEAYDMLIAFLRKFSVPCLKAFLYGTALPEYPNESNASIIAVSLYVRMLYNKGTGKLDDFIVLVKGNICANALLCPDLESFSSLYKDTYFYLDTRLLLQVLGLEGEFAKQAIDELISLLLNLKGRIACFTHTYEETLDVINAAAEKLDSPEGIGRIILEARKSGQTKSDLLLIASQMDSLLEKTKIEVIDHPAYIAKFQIDENAFSDCLDDELHYNNPKAKERDIDSVRSIYVLRGKNSPKTIETCTALLVTTNSAFAKAAFSYGQSFASTRDVSPVVTDFSLATLAWLKAPLGAISLPEKELLAFAHAALSPSESFWRKAIAKADKLFADGTITERDHQFFRSSPKIIVDLVEMTLGSENELTERSLMDVLEKNTADIKQNEHLLLVAEEKRHKQTLIQLNSEREKNNNISQSLYWIVNSIARICASILMFFVICIFVVASILANYKFEFVSWVWAIIAFILILVITLANLIYGKSLIHLRNKIKVYIHNFIMRFLLNKK